MPLFKRPFRGLRIQKPQAPADREWSEPPVPFEIFDGMTGNAEPLPPFIEPPEEPEAPVAA